MSSCVHFGGDEEVDAVHDDRAAERGAELIPVVPIACPARLRPPPRELVDLVHRLVAEELVAFAAEDIRAALGDDVDHAARAAAVFGGRLAGEHLEFLDRRLREVLPRLAGLRRHVHRAVREAVARELQRAGADLRVAAARPRAVLARAGQQQRERHRRAVGDRQHLDLLLRDDRGDFALGHLDHRRLPGDDDRFLAACSGPS